MGFSLLIFLAGLVCHLAIIVVSIGVERSVIMISINPFANPLTHNPVLNTSSTC